MLALLVEMTSHCREGVRSVLSHLGYSNVWKVYEPFGNSVDECRRSRRSICSVVEFHFLCNRVKLSCIVDDCVIVAVDVVEDGMICCETRNGRLRFRHRNHPEFVERMTCTRENDVVITIQDVYFVFVIGSSVAMITQYADREEGVFQVWEDIGMSC